VRDDVIAVLALENPFRMGNSGVKTALATSEGDQISANVDTNVL
jgi:hypothetical protein